MWPRAIIVAAAAMMAACGGGGRPTTARAITADYPAHIGRSLRVTGTVVRDAGIVQYVWVGVANYFTVEDATGRINVWHGLMRCQPRLGSRVTVDGGVSKPENATFHMFNLRRLSIHSSPPLGENEVRACDLPRDEAEIYARDGPEALIEHWNRTGKSVRKVVD